MHGDIRDTWRIEAVERKAEESNRRLYELDTISRDVARMESENGELRACINGLCVTCENLVARIEAIELLTQEG